MKLYTPPEPDYTHWGRGLEPVIGFTETQLRSEVERVRRETIEACIQKLNANPYNLTKAECISEIRGLLK